MVGPGDPSGGDGPEALLRGEMEEVRSSTRHEKGEREEMGRSKNIGVYEYVSREEGERHPVGKPVKAKWVQINMGPQHIPKCDAYS